MRNFNEIHEFVFAGFFVWNISIVCILLLVLQIIIVQCICRFNCYTISHLSHQLLKNISFVQSTDSSNPIELISPLVLILWSIVALFRFCEVGERVTNQFNVYNKELDRCKWYKYPIEIQRIFATAVLNSQQPVIIRGYGNTLCTRDAFRQVSF